jgi:hypothetical protein
LSNTEPHADRQLDARTEYSARLQHATSEYARLARRERSLRGWQVATILIGVVPVALAFGLVPLVWLIAPALAFLALVYWQQRIRRAFRRSGLLRDYYARGLARLDGNWAGTGDPGRDLAPRGHPFAANLDLFGTGSLFERIATARTRAGAQTLASWLLTSATAAEIQARQQAIDDLRGRLDLRETLCLRGTEVPAAIDLDGLKRWAVEPPHLPTRRRGLALWVLMQLLTLLLVGWQGGHPVAVAARVVLLGNALFWLLHFRQVSRVAAPLMRRSRDLAVWNALLQCIERETFRSTALRQLQDSLCVAGQPPSRCVRRLARLAARLRLMENVELRWLGWLELRTTRVAFGLEAWRKVHGAHIARWVESVASFEALASLAAYAYENPSDPFADLVPSGPCFEAEDLGHPLLPRGQCVTNDLALDSQRQSLLVTGSNMSGKSTLLRAVGVNAVLAQAGAPVRARRLRLSPLTVAASLRVQDSLAAGESRFLAEIRRLRQMVDLARKTPPLLFLIDEILQGTNPADRRQGAESFILGLLGTGAIGLVTTHDLPVTAVAERPGVRMVNVHFADQIVDGKILFDYRMRAGVVQQSNALALMRMVGLPAGDEKTAMGGH